MRLIDADALKEKLEKIADINNPKWSYDFMMIAKIMIDILNEASTVEERQHGYWIEKLLAGNTTVTCSCCKTLFIKNSTKFACYPYCEAIMDGESND